MELLEFQFEHLDLFTWRADDLKTYNINSEFVAAIISAERKGQIWTAFHAGRILVIGGILPHSKRTGYCFTLFSKWAEQHKIASARLVRRMFARMLDDMGYHRVVTYNRVDAGSHNNWCEWLGFVREGIIRKFDDAGNDYYQYALVK